MNKIKRRIIEIDADKCNGCSACATACHEGAIGMIDGKAKLLRDDYCDGLGDCLPTCPTGAITFVEREALAFDKEAVMAKMRKEGKTMPRGGCPGSKVNSIIRNQSDIDTTHNIATTACSPTSQLLQWPVQIKLVPTNAPYFNGAKLLIAADCTAFSYANFHEDFIKNHITLIGCPKLDDGDYSDKLAEIIKENNIKSITIVRMEVPCCGGIENATKIALQASGKFLPWQVVTISTDGRILD